MTSILTVLQISYLLVSPLLYILVGLQVTDFVASRFTLSPWSCSRPVQLCALFLIGLLVYLTSVFLLLCAGVSWPVAGFAPYLLILSRLKSIKSLLHELIPQPHGNFLLWFLVVLWSGSTLINTHDGIATAWKNNYGDLTFHLGMISSFAAGVNFPPQYHIFPGETLSYPFFINLWTASFWWFNPEFRLLPLIFVVQWVCLWTVIYRLFNGDRFWLLPWALFFGGGSIYAIGANSGELIEHLFPWTNFLTTIWVTQRTTVLGSAVVLAALSLLFHSRKGSVKDRSPELWFAALLLALAPLVHTHFVLVAQLFCVAVLVSDAIRNHAWKPLTSWVCVSMISAIFLPWLIGKGGAVSIHAGWKPYLDQPLLLQSAAMWWANAPFWLLSVVLYWIVSRRHLFVAILAALFLFANIVQIAYWDWDQIKIFLGIYMISLFLWSELESRAAWRTHVALVTLLAVGAFEYGKLLIEAPMFVVYSKDEVEKAEAIRRVTAPHDIIAGSPDHNSLITLTGRPLFSGYAGTLSSHGLNYQARADLQQSLASLPDCPTQMPQQVCPRYILWTEKDKGFWKVARPPPEHYKKTDLDFLFRIFGQYLP